jgi:tRNA dihydrouridine synthase A
VCALLQALGEAVHPTPVTVKCRIGVDDIDDYGSLHRFIDIVSSRSPVRHFIVHARKCLLNGLSPHQNRTIPPLKYHWVLALKRDFPALDFTVNGGLQSPAEAVDVLAYRGPWRERVHGVMIGRAAYNSPWHTLACADTLVFGAARNPATCRRQVRAQCLAAAWCPYSMDACSSISVSVALQSQQQLEAQPAVVTLLRHPGAALSCRSYEIIASMLTP